jgi:hypothetical protein
MATDRNGSLLRHRIATSPPPSCDRVRAGELAGLLLVLIVLLLALGALWLVTP